jgi:uncharacterized membrane protein
MWIIYSLLCALFLALTDFFTKKFLPVLNEKQVVIGRLLFAVPILWILVFIEGMPVISEKIIWVYLIGIPLEALALALYIKALNISALSVTVPFLSFTPVFLLITSPLLISEMPGVTGVIGVIIIACGAYILNFSSLENYLDPFKKMIKERGSLLMLIVAFIYSITSIIGKHGVLFSSVTFFAASYLTGVLTIYFILFLKKLSFKDLLKKELAIIGFLSGAMYFFHMSALKLIYVSYMISVKRSSLIFSILLGIFFLKEKGGLAKVFGGILMLAGILIISLSNN